MFYVLNFDNHEFISCDNASMAEAKIRSLLHSGTAADSLEIVNGFADECRFNVSDFRSYSEALDLMDKKTVHALMNPEGGTRSSDDKQHNSCKNDKSQYAVFVKLEGVIYVDAASEEQAARIAEHSGNDDVSWDEWFSVQNIQLEKAAPSKAPDPVSDIKLEVGMVGTIKNDPDIKKDLRGKSFVITELDDQSLYASCSIEGKSGTYAVAKYNMKNVSKPKDRMLSHPSLSEQIQTASFRTAESQPLSNTKVKEPETEI